MNSDSEKLLEKMKSAGIAPGRGTYVALLGALGKGSQTNKAEELVSTLEETGPKPDITILNGLLDAYGQAGEFDKMDNFLEQLKNGPHKPDKTSFEIVIDFHGELGNEGVVEELFKEMVQWDLKPTVKVWNGMMKVHAKKQMLRRCLNILKKMKDSGIGPNQHTKTLLMKACRSEAQKEEVQRLLHADLGL